MVLSASDIVRAALAKRRTIVHASAMRPEALNPLFAEIETLEGVGSKLKKPLTRLGLERVRDVVFHIPDRFVSRRAVANIDEARGERAHSR